MSQGVNGCLYSTSKNMSSNTSTTLQEFMNERKVKKGDSFTHLMMGSSCGSFNIIKDDLLEFYDLYDKEIKGGKKLSILEKHLSQGPITIDLDFRSNESDVLYSLDDIVSFVNHYNGCLRDHLEISDEQLMCFVMENSLVRESKGVYKSGLHIIYPYCCTVPDVQHSIRNRIIQNHKDLDFFNNPKITNSFEDVFDKCVIDKNAWFMYGSGKEDSEPYVVSYIFNHDMSNINTVEYIEAIENVTTMGQHCSIRKFEPKHIIPMCDIELTITKKKKRVTIPKLNRDKSDKNNHEIETAKCLVSMLSSDRADDYEKWRDLGYCLHNIDDSLLEVWNEFSKKNSQKYVPGECMEIWGLMKDEGLHMGSLHRWAREDNVDEYLEFKRQRSEACMDESLSGTHYDVAKLMFELYNHQYVFVGTKRDKCWYEFKQHIWQICENANTIVRKIPEDLVERYNQLKERYSAEYIKATDPKQKETLMANSKLCDKIIKNLKTTSFQASVITQCEHLFFDCQFNKKLNENPDLMAFNNGILEIKTQTFRSGRPEDYISMCTKTNYISLEQGLKKRNFKKYYNQVQDFVKQIHPDNDMRQYVMTLVASFLWGYNKEEIFPNWIGTGGNGKSLLVGLMEKALGEYMGTGAIAMITKPRAASNVARPELYVFKGKRIISFQEPENTDIIQSGQVKEFTGCPTISCRGMYKDQEEFLNQASIMMCSNHRLPPSGNDGGFDRRYKEVPFLVKAVDKPDPNDRYQIKIDRTIKQRIDHWVEPFISIIVDIYLPIYFSEGLFEPDRVTQFTKEYQQEMNVFAGFMNDCIIITKDKKDKMNITSLYTRFKSWYQEAEGNKPPSRKELKNYMNNNYKRMEKTFWTGLKFATFEDDIDIVLKENNKQKSVLDM